MEKMIHISVIDLSLIESCISKIIGMDYSLLDVELHPH